MRNEERKPTIRSVLVALLASALVVLGLAAVPTGYASSQSKTTTSGENQGADKNQPANHGDCPPHNTTGVHNGYDCTQPSSGSSQDNDGDHDNGSDSPEDNDADDQAGAPEDNDADEQPGAPVDNDGSGNTQTNDGDNDADDTNGVDFDGSGNNQTNDGDNDADDPGNATNTTTATTATVGPNGVTVGGLQGVSGKKAVKVACASRRAFIIHIRRQHGITLRKATVFLNGRKIKTVRGAGHLAAGIRLAGLPKGTFRVKITAVTSTGRVLHGLRTYHTCVPHRKRTVPKL
jgi:hypothetical protein